MQTRTAPPRKHRARAVTAWLRIARVFSRIDHRSSEELRNWNLTPAQLDVLARVGSDEGTTQQEVADALLVTKGNVCQLIDRMEHAGLLERRPQGRTNRLWLTEKGRTLHATVEPAHDALIAEQLSALTADEQAQFLRLIRKLDRSLR